MASIGTIFYINDVSGSRSQGLDRVIRIEPRRRKRSRSRVAARRRNIADHAARHRKVRLPGSSPSWIGHRWAVPRAVRRRDGKITRCAGRPDLHGHSFVPEPRCRTRNHRETRCSIQFYRCVTIEEVSIDGHVCAAIRGICRIAIAAVRPRNEVREKNDGWRTGGTCRFYSRNRQASRDNCEDCGEHDDFLYCGKQALRGDVLHDGGG